MKTPTASLGCAILAGALLCGLMCPTAPVHAQTGHRCSKDAVAQARKLLAFHFGTDERIEIGKTAKVLPPITNPSEPKQQFDVLEVWGFVYKGQYRMRIIYARMPGECLLMGQ